MGAVIEMAGRRFGRLVVIEKSHQNKYGTWFWRCVCDCGTEKIANGFTMRRGETLSCGCLSKQTTGDRSRKHGLSNHPLYSAWKAMNLRCSNPDHPSYKHYGARGIVVCSEWAADFLTFYYWALRAGWKKGLEIDRENNNGIYSPGNCRFVTRREQMLNTRRSKKRREV